ncbi:MAG: hypothetical protein F6K36_08145 [Symploca sp. SIO3C6]|nr:hypothetical protein [Symploca sp. SIO3C6]
MRTRQLIRSLSLIILFVFLLTGVYGCQLHGDITIGSECNVLISIFLLPIRILAGILGIILEVLAILDMVFDPFKLGFFWFHLAAAALLGFAINGNCL